MFLLDHAFTIFNNLPPRMVIREMTSHVAWPESCFQAATAQDCEAEVHAWTARSPFLCNLTICEAIEMVCKGDMGDEMHRVFADLGPLNLFAIASGKAITGKTYPADCLVLADLPSSVPHPHFSASKYFRGRRSIGGCWTWPFQLEMHLGAILCHACLDSST